MALGTIAERFPTVAKTAFGNPGDGRSDEEFTACLAALPDGCWLAVDEVYYSIGRLPLAAVPHVARLCPRLRRIAAECGRSDSGAALAAACEGLVAVAGTLHSLQLFISMADSDAVRTAAALTRLSSLQQLKLLSSDPFNAPELLGAALPSLQQLVSLKVRIFRSTNAPAPQLAAWPVALRELDLCGTGRQGDTWLLDMLAAAPQLGGVTKLGMSG